MDPADPRNINRIEQSLAAAADHLPSYWWRMYRNLLAEGFTEEQAMSILFAHVHAQSGGKL